MLSWRCWPCAGFVLSWRWLLCAFLEMLVACFLGDFGYVLAPLVKIFATHDDSKGNFKENKIFKAIYTTTIAAVVCFKYDGFQKICPSGFSRIYICCKNSEQKSIRNPQIILINQRFSCFSRFILSTSHQSVQQCHLAH